MDHSTRLFESSIASFINLAHFTSLRSKLLLQTREIIHVRKFTLPDRDPVEVPRGRAIRVVLRNVIVNLRQATHGAGARGGTHVGPRTEIKLSHPSQWATWGHAVPHAAAVAR